MINFITEYFKKIKYKLAGGYDSQAYWEKRHKQFGFDIRGVGNKGLSIEENIKQYEQAASTFLDICRNAEIDLSKADVLDIGCGIGFYTNIMKQNGCKSYAGLDITDALFEELRKANPDYKFLQHDITDNPIPGKYNLIIMIDVTQHITDETKFKKAMSHVKNALTDNGVFIVTSWLDPGRVQIYYEKSRSMDDYKSCFPGFNFSSPVVFRDKFIFTIQCRLVKD